MPESQVASRPDLHLNEILRRWSEESPDGVALVCGKDQRTWRDLAERAARCAGALQSAGVRAGDRVAFIDKNSLEYFELLFGASQIGAVLVAVNWRLAPPEIAFIIEDAGAAVCAVGPEFAEAVHGIRDAVPMLECTVGTAGAVPCDVRYDDWVSSSTPASAAVDNDGDATVLQLYTSGTTAHPKGVMSSADNLAASLESALATFSFESQSRVLAAMPLFHIGGAGWAIGGLAAGATSIVLRDLTPQGLIEALVDERITHAFVVPAVIGMLLATPGIEQADVSSLRCLAYGASPISADLLERTMAALEVDLYQVYGMTEATGAATVLTPDDHNTPDLLASAGRPVAGTELQIIDPETSEPVPVGDVGEIWVRSRQVMQGYWNQPAATAETLVQGGWLRTGDAGWVDDDGYLFIRDRVKDMIVSGGENIYPAEVETVLSAHPGVAAAAVIGIPSQKWGESVLAVIVRQSEELNEQQVIDYCRERLAHFKCPTSVTFAESLPMNPTGKILKRELRKPYWSNEDRGVH